MEASPSTLKKQVLCLHGFSQNSLKFSKKLKPLAKFFSDNYSIELLFPNAPFPLFAPDEPISDEEKPYAWLTFHQNLIGLPIEKVREFFSQETIEILGFGTSQAFLEDFLLKNENIIGILAFSQGAVLTTFLLIQAMEKRLKVDLLKKLKFCLLISGLGTKNPVIREIGEVVGEYANGKRKVDVPVMLVHGKKDEFIETEGAERMREYFSNYEEWEHEGKHFVPVKKEDLLIYKKFLDKYLIK